jgi:trehalose 6-phosphate synthase
MAYSGADFPLSMVCAPQRRFVVRLVGQARDPARKRHRELAVSWPDKFAPAAALSLTGTAREGDRMDGLLVCSHRGPYTYEEVDGRLERRRGSGGLVTALSALLRGGAEVSWLACALSDRDREVANGRAVGGGVSTRLLDIPREEHRRFYDDACVTGLGFIFHGLVDQTYTPTFDARFSQGWAAYQKVNHMYAAAAAQWARGRPVLVEDYHLMLVADSLRDTGLRGPGPLAYFHHVPWCSPAYFALLPRRMRIEILTKILAFDTIGFHARRWAQEFLACVEAFLPGAECGPEAVLWRGREVPIVVAPAQVDVPEIRKVVAGTAAERWRQKIGRLVGTRQLVLRVDRIDLWKNIVRGFQAFERMILDKAAEDVTFLAILARSRMHIPEYKRYFAACMREAARINERLDRTGRRPAVEVLLAEDTSDHARALAGLGLADVVVVNSTSDGLNLVAKESAIAGDGRSRLVLSETTGVHEEIGRWAYGVNPFDIEETASALARALSENDRRLELRNAVENDSPDAWVRQRLSAMAAPG